MYERMNKKNKKEEEKSVDVLDQNATSFRQA